MRPSARKAQTPSSDTPTTSLLRGLKAPQEHKATLAGGGRVGGIFVTAGESYVYPAKWSKAGAKAAFDCTNPAMPFFPFAATGKVGRSCLPQSCLERPRTTPSSAPAQAMYEWVLATVIKRCKQEKHVLPSWVPSREADELAGGKRRRARSAAPRSVQAGPPTTRMPEQDLPVPIPELRAGG